MSEKKVHIEALAKLARIELSADESAMLEREIPAILRFVETIQSVDVSQVSSSSPVRNVMREDTGAHEGGVYTEALLKAAPSRHGDRIAVKQVISRNRK